jgi:hypothetical protein
VTALDCIDDPAEAGRRIDRLASATSEAHERAMLSDFVLPPMYCHSVAIDDARQELGDVLDGFMDRRTLKTIGCDTVSSVSDIGSLSFLRFLERP